jgi:ATP-binding cassette subfamily B protein
MARKLRGVLRLDRAVRFVWQAGPAWMAVNGGLLTLQGLLPLAALYLLKRVVDAVTEAASRGGAGAQSVLPLIAAAGAVALLSALCRLLAGLVREAQSLSVTDHMYGVLHARSVAADLAYYENPRYFDTLHRAQQEGPYRPTRIVDGLMRLVQNGISLMAMAGLLFAFHWSLALVLFAAAAPGILVRARFSQRLFTWQRGSTGIERQTHYFNWLLTGDASAKEIRLFGLGELFTERFRVLRGRLRRERLELARRRSLAEFAAETLATLLVFASLAWIARRTLSGAISLGGLVMYFQAFQRGLGHLKEVLGSMAALYEDSLFLTHLYAFLDLAPRIAPPQRPVAPPRPMRRGMRIESLSFTYPGAHRPALEEVSLTIAPGEVIALVGANGSGKTTLVKLLCRLYDPQEGRVLLDGIDLRQFAPAALRREISVIFQDFGRYQLSAGENIGLGDLSARFDPQRIAAAAAEAGAAEVVERLPGGYGCQLGRLFDGGLELSTGEWQKIALARAFIRRAQLVVLDEPTSSMDAATEYEIFRSFRALLQGRAALIISHRFSTVRMADRICVLEAGRIVESGCHETLMTAGGRYRTMFDMQAQNYR